MFPISEKKKEQVKKKVASRILETETMVVLCRVDVYFHKGETISKLAVAGSGQGGKGRRGEKTLHL